MCDSTRSKRTRGRGRRPRRDRGSQVAELEAALKPLPQTYVVRSPGARRRGVTLAFDDGIATLTLNRPDKPECGLQAMMTSLERQLEAWPACRNCAWSSSPVRDERSRPAAT